MQLQSYSMAGVTVSTNRKAAVPCPECYYIFVVTDTQEHQKLILGIFVTDLHFKDVSPLFSTSKQLICTNIYICDLNGNRSNDFGSLNVSFQYMVLPQIVVLIYI